MKLEMIRWIQGRWFCLEDLLRVSLHWSAKVQLRCTQSAIVFIETFSNLITTYFVFTLR